MYQGLVKNFITVERAEQEAEMMDALKKTDSGIHDPQVPVATAWAYMNWMLLEECLGKMEEVTGLELLPTYCYSRIYPKGSILSRHTDRPACQVSATVCLRNAGAPWPFGYDLDGDTMVSMFQGDAVVYAGCDTPHWRDTNTTDTVWQVFLHYVDANGPYTDEADEYLRKSDVVTKWIEEKS